jgi:drug/metabolite transporter (DMT)-like permease
MAEAEPGRPSTARLVAAFAALYLIWGSTYIAILFAIETLPPLIMAGVRFLVAGAVLYAFARLRGTPAPPRRQWGPAAVVGGLLLLCGNGAVVLAELTVPSGIVALLVALVPAWMMAFEWLRPRGVRPTRRTLAGLVVGFAGIVILVGPAELAGQERVHVLGAVTVLFGSIAWAAGSIYARGANLPRSALLTTAMQMLVGGALLVLAGLARGEAAGVDVAAFSLRSVLALGYLVVFGSLIGYTAYIWLLQVSTPARVSTYAYVNPLVAVFLGWALAGEPVGARVLLAAAVIVGAVAVITSGGRGGRGAARGLTGAAGGRHIARAAVRPGPLGQSMRAGEGQ